MVWWYVRCAYPTTFHCEDVALLCEFSIQSLEWDELYLLRGFKHVRGEEKYKCVNWKEFIMRLVMPGCKLCYWFIEGICLLYFLVFRSHTCFVSKL